MGLSTAVQLTGSPTSCFPAAFPEHVELEPLPVWQQVGKNLSLRCRVQGGAPRTQLSAALLQGEETLSRQPVGGDPKYPKEITFTVLASRGDHGANFSCLTELDLRPQGLALFSNVSKVVQLRTFGEALSLYSGQVGSWEEADQAIGEGCREDSDLDSGSQFPTSKGETDS